MDYPGWHRGAREKEEGKATAEGTRNWCERYSCGMTACLKSMGIILPCGVVLWVRSIQYAQVHKPK